MAETWKKPWRFARFAPKITTEICWEMPICRFSEVMSTPPRARSGWLKRFCPREKAQVTIPKGQRMKRQLFLGTSQGLVGVCFVAVSMTSTEDFLAACCAEVYSNVDAMSAWAACVETRGHLLQTSCSRRKILAWQVSRGGHWRRIQQKRISRTHGGTTGKTGRRVRNNGELPGQPIQCDSH